MLQGNLTRACNRQTQRPGPATPTHSRPEIYHLEAPDKKTTPLKLRPSTRRFAQIRPSLPYTYPRATLKLPWNGLSPITPSRVTSHLRIGLPSIVTSTAGWLQGNLAQKVELDPTLTRQRVNTRHANHVCSGFTIQADRRNVSLVTFHTGSLQGNLPQLGYPIPVTYRRVATG